MNFIQKLLAGLAYVNMVVGLLSALEVVGGSVVIPPIYWTNIGGRDYVITDSKITRTR